MHSFSVLNDRRRNKHCDWENWDLDCFLGEQGTFPSRKLAADFEAPPFCIRYTQRNAPLTVSYSNKKKGMCGGVKDADVQSPLMIQTAKVSKENRIPHTDGCVMKHESRQCTQPGFLEDRLCPRPPGTLLMRQL